MTFINIKDKTDVILHGIDDLTITPGDSIHHNNIKQAIYAIAYSFYVMIIKDPRYTDEEVRDYVHEHWRMYSRQYKYNNYPNGAMLREKVDEYLLIMDYSNYTYQTKNEESVYVARNGKGEKTSSGFWFPNNLNMLFFTDISYNTAIEQILQLSVASVARGDIKLVVGDDKVEVIIKNDKIKENPFWKTKIIKTSHILDDGIFYGGLRWYPYLHSTVGNAQNINANMFYSICKLLNGLNEEYRMQSLENKIESGENKIDDQKDVKDED